MSSKTLREVAQGPVWQGIDEQIVYSFDFSAIGEPTSPTVVIYDVGSNANMSSTLLSGTASVSGSAVLTPTVSGLSPNHEYKLVCKATVSGNDLSYYLRLYGEV